MTTSPVPRVGAIELAPLVDELAYGDRLRNVRDSVSANNDKIGNMKTPAGYLYRVGQTAGPR